MVGDTGCGLAGVHVKGVLLGDSWASVGVSQP